TTFRCLRAAAYDSDRERRLEAGAPGSGRQRLRAVSADRRAPGAAEDGGGVAAPRRAPVPDRPPELGALAEALLDRDRRSGAARRGRRDRTGAPPAAPRQRLPEARHDRARHARAHVTVGV